MPFVSIARNALARSFGNSFFFTRRMSNWSSSITPVYVPNSSVILTGVCEIAAFRRLLARNPRLADVRSKLGEVLVQSRRYDEAIALYKESLAQSERFSPDLALALGFAYLEAGQPQQAIVHATLAQDLSPRETNELLARSYSELHRSVPVVNWA